MSRSALAGTVCISWHGLHSRSRSPLHGTVYRVSLSVNALSLAFSDRRERPLVRIWWGGRPNTILTNGRIFKFGGKSLEKVSDPAHLFFQIWRQKFGKSVRPRTFIFYGLAFRRVAQICYLHSSYRYRSSRLGFSALPYSIAHSHLHKKRGVPVHCPISFSRSNSEPEASQPLR